MKNSGAPSMGDLVIHIRDEERNIKCLGLVLKCKGLECLVKWFSPSAPTGWHMRERLKVLSSG